MKIIELWVMFSIWPTGSPTDILDQNVINLEPEIIKTFESFDECETYIEGIIPFYEEQLNQPESRHHSVKIGCFEEE